MQICRQGDGHYIRGLNNQDFFYAEGNLKLITDGCSEGRFSEIGTRLFCQMFSKLETRFDPDKFEENVEAVFSQICSLSPPQNKDEITEFIVNNMLFTIIACFETEDSYVIKAIGDGYIVAINSDNMLSYIRLFYGKKPPYYAYNKLQTDTYSKELHFKTFEFSKKDFKKVGIASDGIAPIAEGRIPDNFDNFFLGKKSNYTPEGIINSHKNLFYDDVTILF